ncbi:Plus3 domain-containing protein [Abeliophyllum distichum]|uniref:Plus3 domain-containing protein n=1 Tax=Abeliophyllum distichum TaxID=126358 RepID=A0ABD1RFX0_9LAMI
MRTRFSVLAPLIAVPPPIRSSPQAETSGEREVVPGTIGRREAEVESGLRTAQVWKCKFFPSEVNEKQLRDWHQAYRVPDDIEFIVLGPNDLADDPSLGYVALNQAVLATGLRLPFPRIVRKFLLKWRIVPTQLCPNGWRIMIDFLILWEQLGFPHSSVREFSSLYSFKSDGKRSGWWYTSVKFSENDSRPDVNIPVRYHERRYISQEPTIESSEISRKARGINEDFRSSSVLIIEENLISARQSLSNSDRPRAREMKDISALLKKKAPAWKKKRKVPAGDQGPSVRQRVDPELHPQCVPSPARSVEEITSFPVRPETSSAQVVRPPSTISRVPPIYLGSTPKKDEVFLRLRGVLSKPVRDFFRSNSLSREDIIGLPLSTRRTIMSVAKCWTPVQQKYLDSMGVVDSMMAASVNTSKASIQLMSASEKMNTLLADVQS